MRVTRKQLFRIILEEKKLLSEGCGGGCGGAPGGCGGDMSDIISLDGTTPEVVGDVVGYEEDYVDDLDSYDDEELLQPATDREFLSREESVKAVVAIAMATACPVTRDTLLAAVEELM